MGTVEIILEWEEVLVVVPAFLRRWGQPHLLALLYRCTYNSECELARQYACDDFLAAMSLSSM
jgi:hypothetical protein